MNQALQPDSLERVECASKDEYDDDGGGAPWSIRPDPCADCLPWTPLVDGGCAAMIAKYAQIHDVSTTRLTTGEPHMKNAKQPIAAGTRYTESARDKAVQQSLSVLEQSLGLDGGALESCRMALLRALPSRDELAGWRCYQNAARRSFGRDGEIEIDQDAGVSVSGDGGAYVQGWLYCSHEDLIASLPHGLLTLESRNGRIGSTTVVFSDPHLLFLGMSWDSEGDDETISAAFEIDGREILRVDGDVWRELESEGMLETVVRCLFQGGESTQALRLMKTCLSHTRVCALPSAVR